MRKRKGVTCATGRVKGEAIADRDKVVLEGALTAAQAHGWSKLTRELVAEAAGVSVGTVNTSFGTMARLREEVMCEAVRREILPIIAQGLAAGDSVARNVRPALRTKALAAL